LQGLDVDKKSLAVSFTDHQQLKQAFRWRDSAAQLLYYVRKHFARQRGAFVNEARLTGFGLLGELVGRFVGRMPSTIVGRRRPRFEQRDLLSQSFPEICPN